MENLPLILYFYIVIGGLILDKDYPKKHKMPFLNDDFIH